MSVPTMETSMEPRQPSLFEKKTNTRLAWARLLGDVHELDAPNDIAVDEDDGRAAGLFGQFVAECDTSALTQYLGQAPNHLARILDVGKTVLPAAGVNPQEQWHRSWV
jgi:hypothetical protein